MKANEAPEKMYLIQDNGLVSYCKHNDTDVEYTCTDAFINKACEWLHKNADKYIWYSDYAEFPGNDTCGMSVDFIEDFKHYMKGE